MITIVRRSRFSGRSAAVFPVVMALVSAGCHQTNPNKLWEIVHEQCVPAELQHRDPMPCVQINLIGGEVEGDVLLKDIHGPYQYLLIPTARRSGIESPELLGVAGARYIADAWEGRHFVEKALKHELPSDHVSLAVNSEYGRSQEQLHIHIDCLKAEVRSALHAHLAGITEQWRALEVPLAGKHYRARRVTGAQAADFNPFRMLADSSPEAANEMGRHTLVVVGAVFEDGSPGFVLLDDRASLWPFDRAHGEELQDELCQ